MSEFSEQENRKVKRLRNESRVFLNIYIEVEEPGMKKKKWARPRIRNSAGSWDPRKGISRLLLVAATLFKKFFKK